MIAVSEFGVAVVATLIVTALIVLIAVLFTLVLRRTRRALSPITATMWLTALGVVITLAGIVDVIWTQVDVGHFGFENTATYRWEIATSGITVIALGLLVVISAQILRAVQNGASRREPFDPA